MITWTQEATSILCGYAKINRAQGQAMLDMLASVIDRYQFFRQVQKTSPTVSYQMKELNELHKHIEKALTCLEQLSDLARMRVKNACVETPDGERRIPTHDYGHALQEAQNSLLILSMAVPRAHDNLYWTTTKKSGRPRDMALLLLGEIREVFDKHSQANRQNRKEYESACIKFVRRTLKEFPGIEAPERLGRILFPRLCQK